MEDDSAGLQTDLKFDGLISSQLLAGVMGIIDVGIGHQAPILLLAHAVNMPFAHSALDTLRRPNSTLNPTRR